MICYRCHRPLKHASASGLGPVCERRSKVQPVPPHERDLFGYDMDKALHAASYRVQVHIDSMAAEAYIAVRNGFRGARERLLGWEVRP